MKRILLMHHSQSGHTTTLAEAVKAGVLELADEIALRERRAAQATLDDLLWAEGLLIGTPENFGYLAGAIKDFLDRTYYPAQNRTVGLPWAMFVSCDNDGTGAVRALERIALGYGWHKIAEPVLVRGAIDDTALARCRELGQTLAAGLSCGLY